MKTTHGWLLALLCLCIASQVLAAEPLYFWHDDAGRPHYSESPPGDNRSYRQLKPNDLPSLHITPPADKKLYPSTRSKGSSGSGAYYQQRSDRDRNRHTKAECRHYESQLRRMERCVRENDCGLTNRELRHKHHHWNVMHHKYCDF